MPLSSEDKECISHTAKTVVVNRILLRSTDCYLAPDFGPESQEQFKIDMSFKIGDGLNLKGIESQIRVGTNIDINVICEAVGLVLSEGIIDLEAEPKIKFKAEFQVRYVVSSEEFDLNKFLVFIKNNTLHTTIPYWREFVGSTCLRMGITPIPIPFFLLGDFSPKNSEESR